MAGIGDKVKFERNNILQQNFTQVRVNEVLL